MTHSSGSALVFAGDEPGSWWVVHCRHPRFAGRLLQADQFNAEPRYAAVLPHGMDVAVPVHFNLGSDVLVITDFIDPVTLGAGESPPQVVLSQPMLEALDACSAAIARIARCDSRFAPLSAQAEQFLVGWRIAGSGDDELDLLHAGGAQVRIRREGGGCSAELIQPPAADALFGWAPTLLHERLQRVAGERAMRLFASGWDRLADDNGATITLDAVARADRGELRWSHDRSDGVPYVAFELASETGRQRRRLAVELEQDVPLTHADRPLDRSDVEVILSLVPSYGLHDAIALVAAQRFGWVENFVERGADADDQPALPYFPCEVELRVDGECLPAVVFEPPGRDGLYRLIVAPHAAPATGPDAAALLPFECVQLERRHFHLPAYL